MRSWALNLLMSAPLACRFAFSETTPSSVETKLLKTTRSVLGPETAPITLVNKVDRLPPLSGGRPNATAIGAAAIATFHVIPV